MLRRARKSRPRRAMPFGWSATGAPVGYGRETSLCAQQQGRLFYHRTHPVVARNILNRSSATPASKGVAPKAPYSNEEIYSRIQKTVLEHRLAPGTKLIEERLAEVSGVSRTKMREVLNKLAHEGLVVLVPNRGAFIASPSRSGARRIRHAAHDRAGNGAALKPHGNNGAGAGIAKARASGKRCAHAQ